MTWCFIWDKVQRRGGRAHAKEPMGQFLQYARLCTGFLPMVHLSTGVDDAGPLRRSFDITDETASHSLSRVRNTLAEQFHNNKLEMIHTPP